MVVCFCCSIVLSLKSGEATTVSCCQWMLGFHFTLLGNDEIHAQDSRGDFIARCWVMLLESAADTVIHDFGAGAGQKLPEHCNPLTSIVQPCWTLKPAPSCYTWHYYRAKNLGCSGFKFLPYPCLVCYLRWLPGLQKGILPCMWYLLLVLDVV